MASAPNCWAAIEHACKHPKVYQLARAKFALQAPNLFGVHKVELSASSAGACVLERWAYLHGLHDLPDDYQQMVTKRDGGTLYGAWIAALFAAGHMALHGPTSFDSVDVEVKGEHDGVPAHVEIVIWRAKPSAGSRQLAVVEFDAAWVVEIKTSFFGGEFTGSRDYHILQAAKEALCVGAPGFSILNVLPAATKRGGTSVKARHFVQDDFRTLDWEQAVHDEYTRLEAARGPVAPQADVKPSEKWRCGSCMYSGCELNPRRAEVAEVSW